MITKNDIDKLCESAEKAGFIFSSDNIELIQWNAGLLTHIPKSLPLNSSAIYIFKWNDFYLKVGKVNENSNPRYQSQHYNPNSSGSNLSKSLLKDAEFQALLGDYTVGAWIKENTTRFNIIIPSHFGKKFVHFAEAFFILKCNPKFEDTRV